MLLLGINFCTIFMIHIALTRDEGSNLLQEYPPMSLLLVRLPFVLSLVVYGWLYFSEIGRLSDCNKT
jgi:hypothetical protein